MSRAHPVKFGFFLCKDPEDFDVLQPLSFGYLKSFLRKYGDFDVDMLFLFDESEINESFDIIGISCTSQDFQDAIRLAQRIKTISKKIVTVVGGFHITCLPYTLASDMDVGFLGEAEQSFLEFMTCFHQTRKIDENNLQQIDGIAFHSRASGSIDSVYVTKPRSPIDPLDRIPFPDRTHSKTNNIYLFTSRGCPFRCTFCSSSQFWKRVRFFSPEYVIREILSIAEEHPTLRSLIFYDDLFIANRSRFVEIADAICDKRLQERFSFSLSVRADLVDAELCGILKRINVSSVSFGAESGSQRMYAYLKGRHGSVEVNQKALDILQSSGIGVTNSYIVGSPSETADDVHRTYHFIIKNMIDGKLARAAVNILSPMPGTTVWNTAKATGVLPDDVEWSRLRGFAAYADSKLGSIENLFLRRLNNRTIYLAEDTLPQARLFELMRFYESVIGKLWSRWDRDVAEMSGSHGEIQDRYALSLLRQKQNIEFVDDGQTNSGYLDGFKFVAEENAYAAYGWARHPVHGTPGKDILLLDQEFNWVAHAVVDKERADVVLCFGDEKMLMSGWHMRIPARTVPPESKVIRAFLYDIKENKAYRLGGEFDIAGETEVADTLISRQGMTDEKHSGSVGNQ